MNDFRSKRPLTSKPSSRAPGKPKPALSNSAGHSVRHQGVGLAREVLCFMLDAVLAIEKRKQKHIDCLDRLQREQSQSSSPRRLGEIARSQAALAESVLATEQLRGLARSSLSGLEMTQAARRLLQAAGVSAR